MIPTALTIALAGLASAMDIASPFQVASFKPLNSVSNLGSRQNQCLPSQDVCGTQFCMPKGGSCCDDSKGTYCRSEYSCYSQGCCPAGKFCGDSPKSGCATGQQECGNVCISSSSVCCGKGNADSKWCDAPQICGADGKCVNKVTTTTSSTATDMSSTPTAPTTSGSSSAKPFSDIYDTDSAEGDGARLDAIIGGTVGGIVAVTLLATTILLLRRHQRKQREASQARDVLQPPPTEPLMQQYPSSSSPHMSNVSPGSGMRFPPHGYLEDHPSSSAYSPSLSTDKIGQLGGGAYSTDPRAGFGTPMPGHGQHGAEQAVIHEMPATSVNERHSHVHELA